MVAYYPYAIGGSVVMVLGLLIFALGGDVSGLFKTFGKGFQYRLDRADMQVKAEEFSLMVVGAGIVGLAHALAAACAGLRVGVLERDARAVGTDERHLVDADVCRHVETSPRRPHRVHGAVELDQATPRH